MEVEVVTWSPWRLEDRLDEIFEIMYYLKTWFSHFWSTSTSFQALHSAYFSHSAAKEGGIRMEVEQNRRGIGLQAV